MKDIGKGGVGTAYDRSPHTQEETLMFVKCSLKSQPLQRTWVQEHLELCRINAADPKGMTSTPSC